MCPVIKSSNGNCHYKTLFNPVLFEHALKGIAVAKSVTAVFITAADATGAIYKCYLKHLPPLVKVPGAQHTEGVTGHISKNKHDQCMEKKHNGKNNTFDPLTFYFAPTCFSFAILQFCNLPHLYNIPPSSSSS